jgi:hypothetical protein
MVKRAHAGSYNSRGFFFVHFKLNALGVHGKKEMIRVVFFRPLLRHFQFNKFVLSAISKSILFCEA